MAKRGRRAGGRGNNQTTRNLPAPPSVSDFGDPWLEEFRERGGRYADLTSASDRRRWHPSSRWPERVQGLRWRPRIVIVDERSPLARHQTYGGRYSLADVVRRRPTKQSRRYGESRTWVHDRQRGPHGVHDVIKYDSLPHRVGFTLPWQVIICVRRKRRREVLHALRFTGKGATRRMRFRRNNEYSEVRC